MLRSMISALPSRLPIISNFKPSFDSRKWQKMGLINLCRYCKSDYLLQATKFKENLITEIENCHNNNLAHTEAVQTLVKHNWTIHQHDSVVEFSKQCGIYQVRMLFQSKMVLPADEEQEKDNQQETYNDQSINVYVYVKKQGGPKWVFSNLQLLNTQEISCVKLSYVEDYQKQKRELIEGTLPQPEYNRMQFHYSSQQYQQAYYDFLTSLGVDNESLASAYIYMIKHEVKYLLRHYQVLKECI